MIQSPKVRRGHLCGEVMATVACDSESVSEPGKSLPRHCLSPNGTIPIGQMKKLRPVEVVLLP